MPKTKAPAQTLEEPKYLKDLVENRTRIHLKLVSGEEVEGRIEYWDATFLRITRHDAPNLFIFKDEVRYFYEVEN